MIKPRQESTSGSRRANGVLARLVVLLLPSLVLVPVATTSAPAHTAGSGATVVPAQHPDVQYLGRWGRLAESMTTVNSGSRVVLRFTGRHLAATFDQSTVTHPPQIYVRVDGRAPVLYTVDRDRLDLTTRLLPRGRVPWGRQVPQPCWRRRGRRYAASARRGPQWWKRRSERIRPVPAVLLLHLWK